MGFRELAFKRGAADLASLLNVKVATLDQLMKHPATMPGLELAGLGVLAAPSLYDLATHHDQTTAEKAKHVAEVGGLGILGLHPAYELYHALKHP